MGLATLKSPRGVDVDVNFCSSPRTPLVTSPVTFPVTSSDGAARLRLHVVWLNENGETPICIANSRTFALGDSGASVSVVSRRFVSRFELPILRLRDELVLRTASGACMPVQHVVRVDFWLQGTSYSWFFYLLEPLIQSVILGRDFFSYPSIAVGPPERRTCERTTSTTHATRQFGNV